MQVSVISPPGRNEQRQKKTKKESCGCASPVNMCVCVEGEREGEEGACTRLAGDVSTVFLPLSAAFTLRPCDKLVGEGDFKPP